MKQSRQTTAASPISPRPVPSPRAVPSAARASLAPALRSVLCAKMPHDHRSPWVDESSHAMAQG